MKPTWIEERRAAPPRAPDACGTLCAACGCWRRPAFATRSRQAGRPSGARPGCCDEAAADRPAEQAERATALRRVIALHLI